MDYIGLNFTHWSRFEISPSPSSLSGLTGLYVTGSAFLLPQLEGDLAVFCTGLEDLEGVTSLVEDPVLAGVFVAEDVLAGVLFLDRCCGGSSSKSSKYLLFGVLSLVELLEGITSVRVCR